MAEGVVPGDLRGLHKICRQSEPIALRIMPVWRAAMKIWLTRVANCSSVSVSIVFTGLWLTDQFNSLGISLQGAVALAVGISLTNVIAVNLMDLARKSRGRTD